MLAILGFLATACSKNVEGRTTVQTAEYARFRTVLEGGNCYFSLIETGIPGVSEIQVTMTDGRNRTLADDVGNGVFVTKYPEAGGVCAQVDEATMQDRRGEIFQLPHCSVISDRRNYKDVDAECRAKRPSSPERDG